MDAVYRVLPPSFTPLIKAPLKNNKEEGCQRILKAIPSIPEVVSPKSLQGKITKATKSFQRLTDLLTPATEAGELHVNDIYMTTAEQTGVPLVYKPKEKKEARKIAIGYHLLAQLGLAEAMPYTTAAKAQNLVSSCDLDQHYTRLFIEGQEVLVNLQNAFRYLPAEQISFFLQDYLIQKKSAPYALLKNKLFIVKEKGKVEPVPSYLEHYLDKKNQFQKIEATEGCFLIPLKASRYLVDSESEAELIIEGVRYQLLPSADLFEEEDESSLFSLDSESFDETDFDETDLDEIDRSASKNQNDFPLKSPLAEENDFSSAFNRSLSFDGEEKGPSTLFQLYREGLPLNESHPLSEARYRLLKETSSQKMHAFLANQLFPIEEEKVRDPDGTVYKVMQKEDLFMLIKEISSLAEELAFDSGQPLLEIEDEGISYLIAKEAIYPIVKKKDKEQIFRQNLPFDLALDDFGTYTLIGHHLLGALQQKVESFFVGKEEGLDITQKKTAQERELFYRRIHPAGFIQALLAAAVLRGQDFKVEQLKEANILFKVLPNEQGKVEAKDPNCLLWPLLIDTDETLPEQNESNAAFAAKGEVAPIRCSLLAFPLAHDLLTGEAKKYTLDKIKAIVAAQEQIEALFAQSELSEKQKEATLEIVFKLKDFLARYGQESSNLYLKNLIFFLFPTYRKHWEWLQLNSQLSLEEMASTVGFLSLEEMQKQWGKG